MDITIKDLRWHFEFQEYVFKLLADNDYKVLKIYVHFIEIFNQVKIFWNFPAQPAVLKEY